ncbi:mitovirus RNA-dependent RNA polymerase [Striga asiatica]|uniref:Mitovirus RNA-dependent RNA polymerase n=1 Tax=Striga asiatica TaxID=4170 RepID=A0A5A7PZD5_STRAF|nr:mitovirus RNA-dependent RNA polymerase [Striga asiatica]
MSFAKSVVNRDYCSCPLFAFSHHLLVWWAAERVYPGLRFDRYVVLGDDVLITDPEVAQYHKSLVSSSGAAEFAKRFLIRDMRVDLPPISMKALLGFHHPFGLIALKEKSSLSYSLLMRVGGAGYRVWSQGRKGSPLTFLD